MNVSPWSATALETFPRYLVLEDVLRAVEGLRPDSAGSVVEFREELRTAALRARGWATEGLHDAVAQSVMAEERAAFVGYISSVTDEEMQMVEPLPHRRTLAPEEEAALRRTLLDRWGAGRGYWFPISGEAPPEFALAFHTDWFDEAKGRVVGELLGAHGVERVFELREHGEDHYEIGLKAFDPHYNGAEGFWFSRESDWVVYASHESSITIAGEWLVAGFRERFGDCNRYQYGGPFSTPDLRGTWDWESAK